jgi:hypothetical protein
MPGRSKAKLVPYSARRKHDPRRAASGPEKQIHAMLREKGIAFTREKLIGGCHVLNGDSAGSRMAVAGARIGGRNGGWHVGSLGRSLLRWLARGPRYRLTRTDKRQTRNNQFLRLSR